MRQLNQLSFDEIDSQEGLLKELFGSVGENPCVEDNFHCDLGYNIHVGNHF